MKTFKDKEKDKEKSKESLSDSLKNLEGILEWFETREEIDLEEGLAKMKEGARLIQVSRERLKKVENEFKAVRKELGNE